MERKRFVSVILVLSLLSVGTAIGAQQKKKKSKQPPSSAVAGEVTESSRFLGGLCIVIGDVDTVFAEKYGTINYVVHMLSKDLDSLSVARKLSAQWRQRGAKCHASSWSGKVLPYVDNLANVILLGGSSEVPESELLRVLRPGGVAILGSGKSRRSIRKTEPGGTDQWTHPWHGAAGGLVSDDQKVGVPTGIQWVHGPLFPMDGRKTSTQSVVTAGGRHFAITQNVVDNIGKPKMAPYLVARDAYNGLVLWQRPWMGPSSSQSGRLNPLIVASSDRVYVGWFDGIEVFNAANGALIERIDVVGPMTKLIVHDKFLLVQCDSKLACHVLSNAPSAKAWELEGNVDGTVVDGERVYAFLQKRASKGNRAGELVCASLRDGTIKWRIGTDAWPAADGRLRICFANDGYVALIDRSPESGTRKKSRFGKGLLPGHGSLHMFRGKTGEHLWSQASKAVPGKSYADERYVGHFYRNGLVWMQLKNSPRKIDGRAVWAAFDPETGKEKRRLQTSGSWPRTKSPAKMGCQLMVASDRYIMVSRQATFIDFETGAKHPFKFMRGGCGSGFVPANGLLYSSPHACGCYTEVVRGFLASHSLPIPNASQLTKEDRLSRFSDGPVPTGKAVESAPDDWPMHRYDATRSAASPTKVPETLAPRWTASVRRPLTGPSDAAWRIRSGMPITAPVIAGDKVYVCDVEDHRVVAIDDATGEVRWQFIAGGRIDSPPTIFEGRCLFGSHDGYVYCLRAEDGALLWRYLVAPLDRRIVAFGQIESAWPVAGSVLVRGRVAYAAAGRAPDADGGITIVALDTRTGEALWSAKSRAEMVGMCDYLVAAGEQVFLANLGFDLKTGKCTPTKAPSHLRGGKAGLLETSWLDANLALRKSIHTWTARGAEGELLAMGAQGTFGCRVAEGKSALFGTGSRKWSINVKAPRQVRALVVAGHHLLWASAKARYSPAQGGVLTLSNTRDGATVTEVALPAPPVFDGLAVAHERVYISLVNGTLLSLGRPD